MYLIPLTFHYFLFTSFINSNNPPSPRTITPTTHINTQSRPLHSTTSTTTTATPTRGSNYGPSHNSTIPLATTSATLLNVRPPLDAPKSTWQRAWNLQKKALPLLHLFDASRPPNADLCLACLWWKALSGGDESSPVYDFGIAYDCLPSIARWIVSRRLVRWYPRLHHANVEIRTAYLDKLVRDAASLATRKGKKCRLVSLGAGYDTRSIRMMLEGTVDDCVELDREEVVMAKERMMTRLQRRRQRGRRRWAWRRRRQDMGDDGTGTNLRLPRLRSVDLNDVDGVKSILKDIAVDCDEWNTIFLFEGVMIYLDESVPSRLLKVCSDVLLEQQQQQHQQHNTQQCDDDNDDDDDDDDSTIGFLCFADRLENVPGGDEQLGREEFLRNGWTLINWLPKPGLARHMGLAKLLRM